jgi:hypothetical protein
MSFKYSSTGGGIVIYLIILIAVLKSDDTVIRCSRPPKELTPICQAVTQYIFTDGEKQFTPVKVNASSRSSYSSKTHKSYVSYTITFVSQRDREYQALTTDSEPHMKTELAKAEAFLKPESTIASYRSRELRSRWPRLLGLGVLMLIFPGSLLIRKALRI